MTTTAKLLAKKEELLKGMEQDDLGPNERAEMEHLLAKIEPARRCRPWRSFLDV
jgi:hypothetical protein